MRSRWRKEVVIWWIVLGLLSIAGIVLANVEGMLRDLCCCCCFLLSFFIADFAGLVV